MNLLWWFRLYIMEFSSMGLQYIIQGIIRLLEAALTHTQAIFQQRNTEALSSVCEIFWLPILLKLSEIKSFSEEEQNSRIGKEAEEKLQTLVATLKDGLLQVYSMNMLV